MVMKIYNRRNFAAGILSLLLAAACGIVLLLGGAWSVLRFARRSAAARLT